MPVSSRPPYKAAPRITLSMPARRWPANLRRAPLCDGYDRDTFQFPHADLNARAKRIEQAREARNLCAKVALTSAILAVIIWALYQTALKASANVPLTLAQAEQMRGM